MATNDFIVDICLMKKHKDNTPPGYSLLEKSFGPNRDSNGTDVNLSKTAFYLCFRRGAGPDKDIEIVSEVALITSGEPIPEGFKPLTNSCGGHPGFLNKEKMVCCIKKTLRATASKGIYDMIIVRTGAKYKEVEPADYVRFPRNLNDGNASDPQYLCVRYLPVSSRGGGQAAPSVPLQQGQSTISGPLNSFDAYVKVAQSMPRPLQSDTGVSSLRQSSAAGRRPLAGIPLRSRPRMNAAAYYPAPLMPCLTLAAIDSKYAYSFEYERAALNQR